MKKQAFLWNTLGITLTVVGMGGTLLILWILSACMYVLKKIYSPDGNVKSSEKNKEGV